MILAEAIKAARVRVGLTQDELARRSKVSRSAIAAMEAGRGDMSSLARIVDILDFRINRLGKGSTIALQCQHRREKAGLTKAEAATKMGVSIPTIRSIEAGRASLATLQKWFDVFAPRADLRALERTRHKAGKRDVRLTPPVVIEAVRAAFGPIDLDPCHHEGSFVEPGRGITKEENALVTPWSGDVAFMNPPYSMNSQFIERAFAAFQAQEVKTIVALLPVRTNIAAWHQYIWGVADVIFVAGRIAFYSSDRTEMGLTPFELCYVVWGGRREEVEELQRRVGGYIVWSHS